MVVALCGISMEQLREEHAESSRTSILYWSLTGGIQMLGNKPFSAALPTSVLLCRFDIPSAPDLDHSFRRLSGPELMMR